MKAPELLATLAREAIETDKHACQRAVDAQREAGKLPTFDQGGYTWTFRPGAAAAELWLGEAPPRAGDILQIVPGHEWGGILVVVDEVKDFGVLAYHQRSPAPTAPTSAATKAPLTMGRAYIRLEWADAERTGGHVAVKP